MQDACLLPILHVSSRVLRAQTFCIDMADCLLEGSRRDWGDGVRCEHRPHKCEDLGAKAQNHVKLEIVVQVSKTGISVVR